jgi:hypothetical protein
MKRIILLSVLFLGAALGDAMADCRGTRVQDIQAALENKFVCAARAPGGNLDTWSEEHGTLATGGILTEYAKGPGDPIDPRKPVGTWSVTANNTPGATVSYSYTGDSGSPYRWSLFFLGVNSYQFCSNNGLTPIATANITALPVNAANPCPLRQ